MVKPIRAHARLSFLDCLRGIAALAVCVEHSGYHLWAQFRSLTHNYFSFGKFGVATFFLTSGFVIPYSLENSNSLSRFWTSRFFRLYPLYWLSIAVGVALLCFGAVDITDPGFPAHTLRNTLVNLTMFQGYLGIPNVINLYYTLGMEMAFYIAFSLLFLKQLHRRSVSIAWLVSSVVAVSAILIPLVLHRRVPLAGLFYILCLAVGTSVYRNFNGEASHRSLMALLSFVALSVPVAIYFNYVFIKKDDPLEHYSLWAVLAPWSAAFIVFLVSYLLRAHSFPRPLVWLGMISYSVYLLHPAVIAVVPVWHNPMYSLLVIVGLTIIISSCTYRYIERPGVVLGKRVYARVEKAPRRATTAAGLPEPVRVEHASKVSA